MRTPNLAAIRAELPHGSITKIANSIGETTKFVTEFFNYGWHQERSNQILTEAMAIIQDKYPDEDLLEQIDNFGLSGYSAPKKKPRQRQKEKEGIDLLGLAAFAGVGFLIYKNWDKIQALLGLSNGEKKSVEDRLAELKRKPQGARQASTGGA